jgi:hypothetical protein
MAADIIIGRSGDSLLGTVLNREFGIKTSFGDLTVKKNQVAWIHFTDPPRFEVDEIWLHAGDRLLGKVTGTEIRFRPSGGKEIQVPYSAIHTLMVDGGIDSRARPLLPE